MVHAPQVGVLVLSNLLLDPQVVYSLSRSSLAFVANSMPLLQVREGVAALLVDPPRQERPECPNFGSFEKGHRENESGPVLGSLLQVL